MVRGIALCVVLCMCAGISFGYSTKILSQSEECYSEMVQPNEFVAFAFTVTHGGKKDLNVRLFATALEATKQNNKIAATKQFDLEDWTLANEGTYDYNAKQLLGREPSFALSRDHPTKLTACFGNKMSRWTPKWVSFMFHKMADDSVGRDGVATGETELEHKLHAEALKVYDVRTKMHQLRQQEERHRDMVESTNSWMLYGTVFNGVMLIVFSFFQNWYLKRFLSTRPQLSMRL